MAKKVNLKYINELIKPDFGGADLKHSEWQDEYILRLWYKHGFHTVVIKCHIPWKLLESRVEPEKFILHLHKEQLNLRDTKIKDVIFWTSCLDIS